MEMIKNRCLARSSRNLILPMIAFGDGRARQNKDEMGRLSIHGIKIIVLYNWRVLDECLVCALEVHPDSDEWGEVQPPLKSGAIPLNSDSKRPKAEDAKYCTIGSPGAVVLY